MHPRTQLSASEQTRRDQHRDRVREKQADTLDKATNRGERYSREEDQQIASAKTLTVELAVSMGRTLYGIQKRHQLLEIESKEIVYEALRSRPAGPATVAYEGRVDSAYNGLVNRILTGGTEEAFLTRDDDVNWGYRGTGPRRLAYALLNDVLKLTRDWNVVRRVNWLEKHTDAFKLEVVARLENAQSFTLTLGQVDAWILSHP